MSQPRMRILLATHNGARWLPEQLESYLAQRHDNWVLHVSDDRSQDDTRAVLARFAAAHPGRMAAIETGPGAGSGANFLELLARSVAADPGAVVAFSDQDDVWHPDKLARAAAWLAARQTGPGAAAMRGCPAPSVTSAPDPQTRPQSSPDAAPRRPDPAGATDRTGIAPASGTAPNVAPDAAAPPGEAARAPGAGWVCRTVLTDARLVPTGESRRFARPPGFGNALVQNILAGNTITLDPAAARRVAATVPAARAAGVRYHDWWVYQVLTALGAPIGMEDDPLVFYRQHGGNHLGHHGPLAGRMKRMGTVASGQYARWIDANLAALGAHEADWTAEARRLLRGFRRSRARGGRVQARALARFGIYRQTDRGDREIRMLALMGRL